MREAIKSVIQMCEVIKGCDCVADIDKNSGEIYFLNDEDEMVYTMEFSMETFHDDIAKCVKAVEADLDMLEEVKQKLMVLNLFRPTESREDK